MALPLVAKIVIVFGSVLLLIASGMWVGIAMAVAGIFTLAVLVGGFQHEVDALLFNSANSFVLVALPMFIFLGQIILRSGIASRLYDGVSRWTSIVPGGLLHANIVSCAIFAAISGSSAATAATIGSIAYKEQKPRNYSYKLIAGSIAGGGTLGILIPPSINMIVYGAFVGESVARLFAGGIIPGVIATLLFMGWIAFYSRTHPKLVPKVETISLMSYCRRGLVAFKDVWPVLIIIVIIFWGIYGGLMTPSEAAAVSCSVALVLSAILRRLNLSMLKDAILDSLCISAMLMCIIICAKILSTGVSLLRIPAELTNFAIGLGLSRMWVWVSVVLIYLLLGCFIETLSMMLLTLPVTYGLLVLGLGFNGVWFGVALVLLVECGMLTPPVGLNLYIVHGIAETERFEQVVSGAVPYFVILLSIVGLITVFPQLVTWLPSVLMG